MKKNIALLAPDTYYHIFNRGINKENLFKEKRNYTYFLNNYLKFISPIAKTYAFFCLLKNHFHFLICTRSEDILKKFVPEGKDYSTEKIISLQFSHLFNGYAKTYTSIYHTKKQEQKAVLGITPYGKSYRPISTIKLAEKLELF
jgi:putative transposase